METCVVGIGQTAAGDDGVGLAVLEELGRQPLPRGIELVPLADPLDLVSVLEAKKRVVLVDAVLASPPGVVVEFGPEALAREAACSVSSHGLGAAQAIDLARSLSPNAAEVDLRVVAITIARPVRLGIGFSPEVAAAVPKAAAHVLQLLGR